MSKTKDPQFAVVLTELASNRIGGNYYVKDEFGNLHNHYHSFKIGDVVCLIEDGIDEKTFEDGDNMWQILRPQDYYLLK